MKLETVIKTLEVQRQKYIEKHGFEPHVCPSLSAEIGLCKSVGESSSGDVRYTGPFEQVKCKSLIKLAEMVRGK